MTFWRFADERSLAGLTTLLPSYDASLGWLAGLLAVFAGFALGPTLGRLLSARSPVSRWAWLAGGAATMSVGFWGTQNMALIGFALPTRYHYEPFVGLAALLPAALGCAGAIHVLAAARPSPARLHLGAASLALGIAGMHYTLMEAIRGDVLIAYDPALFALSLALGYGFALLALYVNRMHGPRGRYAWANWLGGSVVLGLTVLANHFVAMGGTWFLDDPAVQSSGTSTAPAFMIPGIAACVLAITSIYWLGALIDGRLAEAAEAVRGSAARHRAVVNAMLDAHLVTDGEGLVCGFNPAAEAMFGCTAAEIIGRPARSLFSEGDGGSAPPLEGTSAAGRRRWVHPRGGRRRDGTPFPMEIAVTSFAVDGTRYASCTIRDLSESWESETRLRRLAAAVECAGDAISIMGPDRRIQYVNAACERQSGFSREEVVGRQAGGAVDDSAHAELWSTVARGRSWTGQVRSRRRDGSAGDEELTVTPVLAGDGTVSGYVAVSRDVTRRLEGELERRRLAEALQHCTDMIEIIDAQGRIVYVNAAFEAASGQRLADIRGSRPEALQDFAPGLESYEDMLRTAYRGGRPWSGTLKSMGPDGESREEDVTVSPMRDERGQVTGYVVVKRDATERRRLEARTRQQQKLQSIGQLAGGVAEKLAAPLEEITRKLQFLQGSFGSLDALLGDLAGLAAGEGPVSAAALAGCLQGSDAGFLRREIPRALAGTGDGIALVSGIVSAMKEIARASADKADVDLNRAIQATITMSASEWQAVAEVGTDLDPALPPVRCVAADVCLVVLNLLVTCAGQVAAATDRGIRAKAVIRVATRRVADRVEISVGHRGPGPGPQARRELFEPGPGAANPLMETAHEIIVRKYGGTLALAADEAAPPGEGWTFMIRLPLEPGAAGSATAAA